MPFKIGTNNPRWNNGNSEYPNHSEFKRARIKVLQRSKGKCEICGAPARLVHHIDGEKNNHSLDNLIALCTICHTPLHCDKNGKRVGGRPTKYGLIYGKSLYDIAEIFGVSYGAVYNWLHKPEKKKWLEEKLKEMNLL